MQPLDTIECRDAVLAPDGQEPDWPEADVVIGNPPFLGGKLLRGVLGGEYVEALQRIYGDRIHGEADLVCHWFDKAQRLVGTSGIARAGLVATNSIRGGRNRPVLDRVLEQGAIFDAWSDEPWVIDGAAVRVSLICFAGKDTGLPMRLNGEDAPRINADLTAGAVELAKAAPWLRTLASPSWATPRTALSISRQARPGMAAAARKSEWRPNAYVLKPWVNGMDLTRRPQGKWIIDFGPSMDEADAALYEAPFAYAAEHIKPIRALNRAPKVRDIWWRHEAPRPNMWGALDGLSRYIVTPRVAKHRLFVWCNAPVCPDSATIAIARDDDTTFGILHSRFHEVWSLRLGTWLGVGNDPRYTPTTTFATFPFPEGLTPDVPAAAYANDPRAAAIAAAARRLIELRDRWLNPPEWVDWIDEPVPGYPKRPVPHRRRRSPATQAPHPHQPLQPTPPMANQRPRHPRHRRSQRLRLGRRHLRRRRPAGTARNQLRQARQLASRYLSNLVS